MKYIVKPGCNLWDKLIEVSTKIKEADNKSLKLAKKLGFKTFRSKSHCLAGGITSFYTEDFEPSKSIYRLAMCKKYSNDFYPINNKANKELLSEIKNLPVVPYESLNGILKYNYMTHMFGNHIRFVPSFYMKDKYALLGFNEAQTKYKPVPGMKEILISEYNKLIKTK